MKGKMKDRYREIILALAENDINPSRAAAELFLHRNTVIYYAKQIKTEIGLDPLKFYDLCKLLKMVKEKKR